MKLTKNAPVALGVCIGLLTYSATVFAQDSAPAATRAYEDRQTFKGYVYRKDTNVWAYTQAFADLFGMPLKDVDDLQGLEAAAFRVEEETNPECGFGGQANVCRTYERCWLDMYFDEKKVNLPWATEIQSQWVPRNASMVMLPTDRSEKPRGILEVATPGVIRRQSSASPLVAFVNPQTRQQADFVTNAHDGSARSNEPTYTQTSSAGVLALNGYSRNIFRDLSVVSVHWGCMATSRKIAPIHLASVVSETETVRLHKMLLPEGFVSRINARLRQNSERDRAFNRSLFPPSMGGTKGLVPTTPSPTPSAP